MYVREWQDNANTPTGGDGKIVAKAAKPGGGAVPVATRREPLGRDSSNKNGWLRRGPRSNPSPENGGEKGGEWGGNSRFSCFRAWTAGGKAAGSEPDYTFRFRPFG